MLSATCRSAGVHAAGKQAKKMLQLRYVNHAATAYYLAKISINFINYYCVIYY